MVAPNRHVEQGSEDPDQTDRPDTTGEYRFGHWWVAVIGRYM